MRSLFLLVLTLSLAHADFKPLPSPCAGGSFALDIEVRAANGVAPGEPTGLRVAYDAGQGKITGRDAGDETSSAFGAQACKRWEKNYWDLFQRLVNDNTFAQRQKLECRNVASISYRAGGDSAKATNASSRCASRALRRTASPASSNGFTTAPIGCSRDEQNNAKTRKPQPLAHARSLACSFGFVCAAVQRRRGQRRL